MIRIINILVALLTFTLSACADKKNIRPLYYKSDVAYEKKVKSFKINYDKALQKVLEYYQKETPVGVKVAAGSHELVVGDWYLFSFSEKTKIPLRGLYVNGYNGKVIFLETSKSIERNQKLETIQLEIEKEKQSKQEVSPKAKGGEK